MKLLASILAGSAISQNPFPRIKNGAFCDTSSVKGSSCQDIYNDNPKASDGIYKIQIGSQRPTAVECKFSDGVGWTVIQKRTDGKLNFNESWAKYKSGFSTFSLGACGRHCNGQEECGIATTGPRPNCDLSEYWIGLDNIHDLTSGGARLRIDLQRYNGNYGTVEYSNFEVGNSATNYRLNSVGNFKNDPQEDIGDSFIGAGFGKQGYSTSDKEDTNHVGWGFTTKDRDNDGYESGNCGREDKSGWWFNRCSAVNLNGNHYGTDSRSLNYSNANKGFDDGILWQTWTNNKYESLIGTRMMVGPKPAQNKAEITGKDCQEIAEKLHSANRLTDKSNGALDDIYKIMPDGTTVPKYTECKFEVCSGQPTGWTMIQKRYDGSVEFNQNWNAYRSGFGCVAESASASPFEGGNMSPKSDRCNKSSPKPSWIGECWLGNEYIHALTGAIGGGSLMIEMSRRSDRSPNNAVVAYQQFSIGDESSNYRLNSISGYTSISGNAGDAFHGSDFGAEGFDHDMQIQDTNHEGMAFSTNDRDNDLYQEGSCGRQDRSGWWFNRCSAANLNGHYYKSGLVDKNGNGFVEYDDGLLWNTWTHTKWESLTKSKMFVGRRGASQQCHRSNQVVEPEVAEPSTDYSEYSSEKSSYSEPAKDHETSDQTVNTAYETWYGDSRSDDY